MKERTIRESARRLNGMRRIGVPRGMHRYLQVRKEDAMDGKRLLLTGDRRHRIAAFCPAGTEGMPLGSEVFPYCSTMADAMPPADIITHVFPPCNV